MAIAVVDDPVVVDGIRGALDASGDLELAGAWTRLDAAYDAWTLAPPDLAVVEATLLGLDPLGSLTAIRDSLRVPIVVRARRPHLDFVHLMVAGGARGVLDAGADGSSTVLTLRDAAKGETQIPAALQRALSQRLLDGADVPYLTLTRREREVLTLVASGATAAEAADRLFIALPTARTHLKAAYTKLGVCGQRDALLTLIALSLLDPGRIRRRERITVAAAKRPGGRGQTDRRSEQETSRTRSRAGSEPAGE